MKLEIVQPLLCSTPFRKYSFSLDAGEGQIDAKILPILIVCKTKVAIVTHSWRESIS